VGTYAELQVTSNFTFLRGASHPEELVERAQALGLAGLSLTDRNSLAGIVGAHQEAKERGFRILVGCRLDLALSHACAGDDALRLERLAALGRAAGARLLATNDVHYHLPERRALQDVLTCIREHTTIDRAASLLFPNAERHLKPPAEMTRLFRDLPEALEGSLEILERCRFSLDELAYDYPVRDRSERTVVEWDKDDLEALRMLKMALS
jgi:DNA polymerase III alpha subunit